MHKRLHQFKEHRFHGKLIILFFCLDLLFMILAFIATLLPSNNSQLFLIIFISVAIIMLIHTAAFCVKNLILVKHLEEYFLQKNYGVSALKINLFHKILDENLFHYYFQPIINAKTGEIFAYEALMRTDLETDGMVPMEILDLAAKEDRLYDIEKLTFFNTLKIMQIYPEIFHTKKLFINSISSYPLTDEDYKKLLKDYYSILPNIVIEITNDTYLKNTNLKLIQTRVKEMNCQLAIDTLGNGVSDETLIHQAIPNYIKIDHMLLRYINIDVKKQTLVSNLINYAREHNIKVIAEGIESYEEFDYIIHQGVDYIQGFYSAKPGPELTPVIAKDLLQKIHEINYKKLNETSINKMYETRGETILTPADIIDGNYSAIVIFEKEITLKGRPGESFNLYLIIPDNQTCTVTLDNLSLKNEDRPCFIIGKNCSVSMKLVGDNYFYHDGIRVPETASLTILGDGNLTLHSNRSSKTGIGGSESQSYGNITLASTGQINVYCCGNTTIGIGGGQNSSNSLIRLLSGNISVETSGYTTIAVGSLLGNANVFIDNCILNVKTEGTKSIGIGCVMGMVNITTGGTLDINCSGRSCIAIGTLEEGNGLITITGGYVKIYFNAYAGTGIGSISNNITINLRNGDVMVHGEGVDIVAIGDHSGLGELKITNGILSIQLIANNSLLTSNLPQKVIIDGGNIQCEFPESITLVNSYGASLIPHIITDTDDFSQMIETISYRYEYKASYSPRYPYIKVYLPENLAIDNFHGFNSIP